MPRRSQEQLVPRLQNRGGAWRTGTEASSGTCWRLWFSVFIALNPSLNIVGVGNCPIREPREHAKVFRRLGLVVIVASVARCHWDAETELRGAQYIQHVWICIPVADYLDFIFVMDTHIFNTRTINSLRNGLRRLLSYQELGSCVSLL